MQHTPPPYKVAKGITGKNDYVYQPDKEHEPDCWRAIVEGPEYAIAQVSGETEAEALATARFFVKACNAHDELLKALKAVELGVFGSMLPGTDIEICTRATRLQVQAAIAKATQS